MAKSVKRAPRVKIVKRMGRPTTLPEFWLAVAKELGSVDESAKAIGKSVRQLHRIAHKESPLTDSTRIIVTALAERLKLTREFEKWVKGR